MPPCFFMMRHKYMNTNRMHACTVLHVWGHIVVLKWLGKKLFNYYYTYTYNFVWYALNF